VKIDLKSVRQGRIPDPIVEKEILKHTAKLLAMDKAILYVDDGKAGPLTSKDMRFHPTTMGTLVCTTCRDALFADVVAINAGAIRGNSDYPTGKLSFSDIRKELPFGTELVVVHIPGKLLSEIIQYSRRNEGKEEGGYLQVDDGVQVDKETRAVTHVKNIPLIPDKDYLLGVTQVGLDGLDNIVPLVKWAKETNPKHTEGIGAKNLIMSEFSKKLWKKLPSFDDIDTDKSGTLSQEEVFKAYAGVFPLDLNNDGIVDDMEQAAAKLVVEQLIACLDKDTNANITREEYEHLVG